MSAENALRNAFDMRKGVFPATTSMRIHLFWLPRGMYNAPTLARVPLFPNRNTVVDDRQWMPACTSGEKLRTKESTFTRPITVLLAPVSMMPGQPLLLATKTSSGFSGLRLLRAAANECLNFAPNSCFTTVIKTNSCSWEGSLTSHDSRAWR